MHKYILLILTVLLLFSIVSCSPANSSLAENDTPIQNDDRISESIDNDFILPDSSNRKLTEEEILQIDSSFLGYARNEIYARKGYMFSNEKYIDYFSSKAWYKPKEQIDTDNLSDIEKYNVNFLKYYEEKWGNNDGYIQDNIKQEYEAFKANEKAYIDLNGDGKNEELVYRNFGDAGYSLDVNGSTVKDDKYTNLADFIAIVDIDKSDNYKEILISDYGPSNDDFSSYYYYNGNKLVYMGETAGVIEYNEIQIDLSGSFSALTRGRILQTWFFKKYYTLTDEHKIVEIPHEVYQTDYDVFVKVGIKLFTGKNLKSSNFDLVEGQIVKIIGTDDKEWCQIETSTGKKGWFAIEGFTKILNEGLDAGEVFAGLCNAD